MEVQHDEFSTTQIGHVLVFILCFRKKSAQCIMNLDPQPRLVKARARTISSINMTSMTYTMRFGAISLPWSSRKPNCLMTLKPQTLYLGCCDDVSSCVIGPCHSMPPMLHSLSLRSGQCLRRTGQFGKYHVELFCI